MFPSLLPYKCPEVQFYHPQVTGPVVTSWICRMPTQESGTNASPLAPLMSLLAHWLWSTECQFPHQAPSQLLCFYHHPSPHFLLNPDRVFTLSWTVYSSMQIILNTVSTDVKVTKCRFLTCRFNAYINKVHFFKYFLSPGERERRAVIPVGFSSPASHLTLLLWVPQPRRASEGKFPIVGRKGNCALFENFISGPQLIWAAGTNTRRVVPVPQSLYS